jgi:general secretion pathway protein D
VEPLPPVSTAAQSPDEADGLLNGPSAKATILPGEQAAPVVPKSAQIAPKSGDISLNFPNADVRVAAKAILGDMLHLDYSVDPSVNGTVSAITSSPVARSSVLEVFERALRASNLALVPQGRGFQITSAANPGAVATIAPGATGYGTEMVTLQFVNAEELKRLLDSLLPGTVSSIDPNRNMLVIAGTTGQRAAVRDILAQFDVNWLRNMSFALYVPQRTDGRLIVPELDKLINDPSAPTRGLVRLISMDKLNGILAISAQPQYLEDVRRWVEILDREGQNNERRLFVYNVQNGRARDLAKTLNTAFGTSAASDAGTNNPNPFATTDGSGTSAPLARSPQPSAPNAISAHAPSASAGSDAAIRASISADETNNAIIVYGAQRDYAVIEDALRKLDVLPFQVMIEAAITEVSLTDNLRYGVQWNFTQGSSNFAQTDGTATDPVTGQATPLLPSRIVPGFSYFYSSSDISATLNALEKRTNVKVISAPKLLVLNNQTAALQVGDQVPITTQSATNLNSSNNNIVNSVEYRDTGVILKVTPPRVNSSGLVLLDIAQEVSDVASNQTSGIDSPTISTRRISTSIAVQDGQVIALGGLFRNSKTYGKNGVPVISRVPVLGSLFGTHNNVQNRTELLVILKPHVLHSGRRASRHRGTPLQAAHGWNRLAPKGKSPDRGEEERAGLCAGRCRGEHCVFALIALMVIEASRGTIVAAGAEADRARVQAAAEAGLAIALRNLMNAGPGGASIDGGSSMCALVKRTSPSPFRTSRGKIPLNALSAAQNPPPVRRAWPQRRSSRHRHRLLSRLAGR